MEKIIWTEGFSVGVVMLDEQHKYLIKVANQLIEAPKVTTNSETISWILSDMLKYAQVHFKSEENLLRRYGYPQLDQHITEHQAFKKQTMSFFQEITVDVSTVPNTMLNYLCEWVVEHILSSDMAYKPFLQEQGCS
jgi:hemerythrin-like metal-binding protein